MHFADGTDLFCGEHHPNSNEEIIYATQEWHGPIVGVRAWTDYSVHPLFYYNACACDFSLSASSATLLLGESASVTATVASADPDGRYAGANDYCASDSVTVSPSSDLLTVSGRSASIATLSGGNPIAGAVSDTVRTFTFTWTTSTGVNEELTYDLVAVRPACAFSAISWSPSVLPITLQVGAE